MLMLRSRSLLFSCRPALSRSMVTARMPPINYKVADDSTYNPVPEGVCPLNSEANRLRPLSPHLTIYEPQLTWLMSIGHRVTGAGLSAAIYAFGIYYAVAAPEAVTETMASWLANDCPGPVMMAGKYCLAAPFVYHTLNGIRHLVH